MTNTERALYAILSCVSPLNDDDPAPWGTYPVRGESHTVFVRAKYMGRHWLEGVPTYYIDPQGTRVVGNSVADDIIAESAAR